MIKHSVFDFQFNKEFDHYFLFEESELHYCHCFYRGLMKFLEINQSAYIFFRNYLIDQTEIANVERLKSKDADWFYDEYEELQHYEVRDDLHNWAFYFNGEHDIGIAGCTANLFPLFNNTFASCATLESKERLKSFKGTFRTEQLYDKFLDTIPKIYIGIKSGFGPPIARIRSLSD